MIDPCLQAEIDRNLRIIEASEKILQQVTNNPSTKPEYRISIDMTIFVARIRLINCLRRLQNEKTNQITPRKTRSECAIPPAKLFISSKTFCVN
ncbi:hypothetical protein Ciccas_003854 [Cichlidogyrus casuarinus]|uniref:Uncharacterized protein n=1 Tax=Cichlidogyrus casuarinus TaxID=1844966 RepID=A0ABD2QD76_9PLAT